MKKISMNPEAMAALQSAEGEVAKPRKAIRIPQVSAARIRQDMMRVMFGESMKPTNKARLLMWTSHAAVKAAWAADHWQKMQAEKAQA